MRSDDLSDAAAYLLNEAVEQLNRMTNGGLAKPETVRTWLQRKHLRLDGNLPGPGLPRFISERDVVRLALMAELVKLGREPGDAGRLASRFTDSGSDKRLPGHTFRDGLTYLVMGAVSGRAQIKNLAPNAPVGDLLEDVDDYRVLLLDLGEVLGRARVAVSRLPRRSGAGAALRRDKPAEPACGPVRSA